MGAKNRKMIGAIPAAAKTMGRERAQQAIHEALEQGHITAEEAVAVAEEVAPW